MGAQGCHEQQARAQAVANGFHHESDFSGWIDEDLR
jgi:hypothetical protein